MRQRVIFGRFRLDTEDERLWRGKQPVRLTPKPFAVLRYLVEHPHRLVSKSELLDALWPGTSVGEAALKVCIAELRRALGDDAKAPRFIETVHRRGYRFIAPVATTAPARDGESGGRMEQQVAPGPSMRAALVDRQEELARLQSCLDKAVSGGRQVVFVTGEAGIGKTTVVEALVASASAAHDLWVGRGQCIEQYGAGEAYMPVLESLGRLCREPAGDRLIQLLGRHAPTWLAQLQPVLGPARLKAVQRRAVGSTRERMLREMAEVIEVLTVERPLLLWLEDLHWSDYSTLELISCLARRLEQARLLVIGTYRPVELAVRDHPLRAVKQELQAHAHCEEIALTCLSEGAVREYLAWRFPAAPDRDAPAPHLARIIHRRTEGNPLFMVAVLADLVRRGLVVEDAGGWRLEAGIDSVHVGVPGSIQQMIESQLDLLEAEERRVVDAASVAGVEFSSTGVAAGLETGLAHVEETCARLMRRSPLVRSCGATRWPDGTVAEGYQFVHALYQEVAYERVPAATRTLLHRKIGERQEAAYGDRAPEEIAAELAMHFERGDNCSRSAYYRVHAARKALQQSGYQETVAHAMAGLDLLKRIPETPERTAHELALHQLLGLSLAATKGYAAPDVKEAYARAEALGDRVGDAAAFFPVLVGVWAFYLIRADFQTARTRAQRLFEIARDRQVRSLLLWSHTALGVTLLHCGELVESRAHLERSLGLYDPQEHSTHVLLYGQDPCVSCLSYLALALWALGYPTQALERSREAVALAEKLAHPFSHAFALTCAAQLHQKRRDAAAAGEQARAAIALTTEHGFAHWLAASTSLHGWALMEQGQEEGIREIPRGREALRRCGAEVNLPLVLGLQAESYASEGRPEKGVELVDEAVAVVEKTGERYHEADLWRLKGDLLLQRGTETPGSRARSAEDCLRRAIAIAREQSAKSLELRAATSLSRLWHSQGKNDDARQLLSEMCSWFTEDSATLQEARILLHQRLG